MKAEVGRKLKTRSGDTIELTDLLDEGLKRSLAELMEKERDKVLTPEELRAAQESMAYGCIKCADLSHTLLNDYVFSFDKMLEDRGNIAVYLLYACSCLCSITRNGGKDFSQLNNVLETVKIKLGYEIESKLAKTLLRLQEIKTLLKISKGLLLHLLYEYCYKVCTTLSEFYDDCHCIAKNEYGVIIKVKCSRILLSEGTALILKECSYILGLEPAEEI
ncbi:putative arginine--tRNA ligase, cytoplasmic isoform 2-T16 [Glossina fuscipes fuscipes]